MMDLEEVLPNLVTWMFSFMQNLVFGVFMIVTVGILRNEGGIPYLKRLWAVFVEIPGVKDVMAMLAKRQVKSFIKETADKIGTNFVRGKKIMQIPDKGIADFLPIIFNHRSCRSFKKNSYKATPTESVVSSPDVLKI